MSRSIIYHSPGLNSDTDTNRWSFSDGISPSSSLAGWPRNYLSWVLTGHITARTTATVKKSGVSTWRIFDDRITIPLQHPAGAKPVSQRGLKTVGFKGETAPILPFWKQSKQRYHRCYSAKDIITLLGGKWRSSDLSISTGSLNSCAMWKIHTVKGDSAHYYSSDDWIRLIDFSGTYVVLGLVTSSQGIRKPFRLLLPKATLSGSGIFVCSLEVEPILLWKNRMANHGWPRQMTRKPGLIISPRDAVKGQCSSWRLGESGQAGGLSLNWVHRSPREIRPGNPVSHSKFGSALL